MELKIETMKLNFNGKPIECKFVTKSHKIKGIFIEKLKDTFESVKTEKLFQVLKDNNVDITDKDIDFEMEGKKLVFAGKLDISDLLATPESIEKKDRIYRELAAVIVDTKQLTTANQEIFSNDPDSEFWLEQDLTVFEPCVDYFRTVFGI